MLKPLNQSQDVIDCLEEFASDPKEFIILSGTNGSGKTYAAMAVYEVVTPYVLPAYDYDIAYFSTQVDLNNRWKQMMKDYGDTQFLSDQIVGAKLFILDDLGTRTPSDAFMDFLYEIADKRYTHRKTRGTIITTNLNAFDMREKFGDAFTSRVSYNKCFRLDYEDRRIIA